MLKFLIIALCVFFFLRILGRVFVVSTFGSMQKRMQDEMKRRQGAGQQMPEGHVTIDPGAAKQQRRNDDGDFVDYEEVK